MIDETPDETPDTPTPDETPETPIPDEGIEPTTAPDEPPSTDDTPAAGETADVTESAAPDEPAAESTDSPADAPAEQDDITSEPAPEPQPDQAEGDDAPAETGAEQAPTEPAAEQPPAEPAPDQPAEPGPEQPPAEPAPDQPAEAPAAEERRPARREREAGKKEPEVIPGAHLEPDLVLEQPAAAGDGDEFARYAEPDEAEGDTAEAPVAEAPAERTPLELAADARYQATGKRKTSIARVILKPGSGTYIVNGKDLDVYFPRPRLQRQARSPLQATGNDRRMDVVARIHGGGVSAQATALRHGIARALVEAEPTLRTELKRRGFLTRDPRETERKKAGFKKARKRPQFSKR
jgi:small subunit ribosomal protein S9